MKRLGVHWWLYAPVALALVLLSRILRPLLLIRFGNLRNHTIGTLSLHAEGYMADRDLGLSPPRTIDLFFHTEPSANRVLNRLLERRLYVTPLTRYAQAFNARIPGGHAHVVEIGNVWRDLARDHFRAFTQTPQHFSLNEAEIAEARHQLHDLVGLPHDAKIICFFSRTSNYLKKLHAGGDIRRPEDFQTTNIRNSSIFTYLAAAEELAQRGYWCFRMGAVADETIPCRNKNIIDYANTFRSELLDIYLISHCELMLSDTTGLRDLSFMFRRPTATANIFRLDLLHSWGGVFIPKKYIVRSSGRLFTLRELLATGGGPSEPTAWPTYAATHELDIEDNTEDEIYELTIEAMQRLKGTWKDDDVDNRRQHRVIELYAGKQLDLGGPLHAVLATTFLRRHPEFLD